MHIEVKGTDSEDDLGPQEVGAIHGRSELTLQGDMERSERLAASDVLVELIERVLHVLGGYA